MRHQVVKERSTAGLVASVAIHVVVVLLIAQMVFRYPIGALIGYSAAEHIKPEAVHFVRVMPAPPATSTSREPTARPQPKGGAPAPLIAPTVIPTSIAPPLPRAEVPAEAAGGTGNGLGVSGGTGIATGLVPAVPDSRIKVTPQGYFAMPTKTPAEKIDSIVADMLGVYIDSLEVASHMRKPGDWTITTKDGKKYGWDQQGIQLGKFMIPNALFALLPLKIQANPTLNSRYDAQERADVLFQWRLTVTEDQFKAAVKRIRERNEKIHDAKERATPGGQPDSTSH
ncbi:MAG: hypothetical protein ACRENQ_09760 [Gemmatimonadaceae bacterium]